MCRSAHFRPSELTTKYAQLDRAEHGYLVRTDLADASLTTLAQISHFTKCTLSAVVNFLAVNIQSNVRTVLYNTGRDIPYGNAFLNENPERRAAQLS